MAVNYKPLNRNQEWSSDEKKVLRKLFGLAEAAADPSTSATISRLVVHKTLAGKLDANEEQDIRTLFDGLRTAIDADDTGYDIVQHSTAFRMNGPKKKIIKTMAEAVVAMISA
jgi:hypothetical protein